MPDDDREDETTFWRQQRNQNFYATPDLDAMRLEAGTVMCPDCHAGIDADCVNAVTGQSLHRFPCHPKRLTAAREAAARKATT